MPLLRWGIVIGPSEHVLLITSITKPHVVPCLVHRLNYAVRRIRAHVVPAGEIFWTPGTRCAHFDFDADVTILVTSQLWLTETLTGGTETRYGIALFRLTLERATVSRKHICQAIQLHPRCKSFVTQFCSC